MRCFSASLSMLVSLSVGHHSVHKLRRTIGKHQGRLPVSIGAAASTRVHWYVRPRCRRAGLGECLARQRVHGRPGVVGAAVASAIRAPECARTSPSCRRPANTSRWHLGSARSPAACRRLGPSSACRSGRQNLLPAGCADSQAPASVVPGS